ncbi:TrmH family RNA methyltransferase [Oryzifoliimicrobium ureilyticus]|uniref:TrmH family RNA methyltransferase n=1 Tax=Oryzifoliimicrobium ureilyticus TaxID=3113724 RepID=UPI003076628B
MALPISIEDADDARIQEFRNIRERDLTGRQQRFIAEGSVVVRMLAQAHARGRFVAEKLLILKSRLAGLEPILELLPEQVPVYVAEADVLDAIVGFNLHRGVLALGKHVEQDLSMDWPKRALVLVGCGISNHDNIGSMFRNAAAFGADAVLLDETCCDPLYRKSLRVSVGSVLSLSWKRGGTALDLLSQLSKDGFNIWALSPQGETDIRSIGGSERVALVVGTEGEGLPAELLAGFMSARIPQAPGLDSLNVATATGIALYALSSLMKRI